MDFCLIGAINLLINTMRIEKIGSFMPHFTYGQLIIDTCYILSYHFNYQTRRCCVFRASESDSSMHLNMADMKKWIELVWRNHVNRVDAPSLLIADTFSSHTAKEVKNVLDKHNTFLNIIPPGCSSSLQPLHRGIKLLFKVSIS